MPVTSEIEETGGEKLPGMLTSRGRFESVQFPQVHPPLAFRLTPSGVYLRAQMKPSLLPVWWETARADLLCTDMADKCHLPPHG